mmetsp:Transcript_26078/g.82781  ORF Transcript_26078/g.82781 Transcript_26078/m.82781 type:complete len:152 (-) Transcript_26078:44-499(-)
MGSKAALLAMLACFALACIGRGTAASPARRGRGLQGDSFAVVCGKWLDCSRSCPRRGCFRSWQEECMEYVQGECNRCTDMGLCSTVAPTMEPTTSPTPLPTLSPSDSPTASAATCNWRCTGCPTTCFVDAGCKEYYLGECRMSECATLPVC